MTFSLLNNNSLLEEVHVLNDKKILRIFCLSDMHVDNENCFEWIKKKCVCPNRESTFSIFICPGDISAEISRISETLRLLKSNYDIVCFTPGNHELWRKGSCRGTSNGHLNLAVDSIHKFNEVLEIASNAGAILGPLHVLNNAKDKVLSIYPLYSWYHSGFDSESPITHPIFLAHEKMIPFARKWSDFRFCTWPGEMMVSAQDFRNIDVDDRRLAEAFASLNEPFLPPRVPIEESASRDPSTYESRYLDANTDADADAPPVSRTIISFSHFLPRVECCPEKRFLLEPNIAKVAGSQILEEQIRRLGSALHVFGHMHIPMDERLDGVRYVQWPKGKEESPSCHVVHSVGPLEIFNDEPGAGGFDEETGLMSSDDTCPSYSSYWSKYYRENCRSDSSSAELAPWVERSMRGGWVSDK